MARASGQWLVEARHLRMVLVVHPETKLWHDVGMGASGGARFRYTVIFDREADGGYHVFCPALKGCHSQGDTLAEAQRNIEEAIAAYLESLKAHGEPIPSEEILVRPVDVAL